MLLAAAGADSIPARPWPLAAACQTLANELPGESPYLDALVAATDTRSGPHAVEAWIQALVERRVFRPVGTANQACWTASADWLENWEIPATQILASERAAWAAAVQALTRTLSIWRKTVSAAAEKSGPSAAH